MQVPLIHWRAKIKPEERLDTEDYPFFGIITKQVGDKATVFYITNKGRLVVCTLSKRRTGFVELGYLEIKSEVLENINQYAESREKLVSYRKQFLACVQKLRVPVDAAEDALLEAQFADRPSKELANARLERQFSAIDQPFPRKWEEPKKKSS